MTSLESKMNDTMLSITIYKKLRQYYENLDDENLMNEIQDLVDSTEGGWGQVAIGFSNILTFLLVDEDECEKALDRISMMMIGYQDGRREH